MPSAVIGQTFKRRRKKGDHRDEIRITGRVADVFICVPARVFASPYTVSGPQLAQEYSVKAAQLDESETEEERLRRLDHAATANATGYFGRAKPAPPQPPADSPEAHFRALDAAAAEKAAAAAAQELKAEDANHD